MHHFCDKREHAVRLGRTIGLSEGAIQRVFAAIEGVYAIYIPRKARVVDIVNYLLSKW